ncbi:MAG: hypothetical protein A2214_00470 [Candidatus Harrisonbacteria bacterium RIFOXYA1_FULL_48_8]|uniref:Uncharacterized protein n=2 Tax=Candidatus Harrisoniibacteriota TaxID=1817905 RepID=A0A1G1ZWZ5_9BACT|nr:MAG: hypothetical protein A3E64_01495 [Candidatus Harrisonbacteria bacterium RIFCSPHIGHO2_12_FULL_48_16]OGY68397.1 MAG: hypothetical protein A2214_00470 [Candidatus Harrisonbacteria bacterium RIFOXYA1_FULL_48_8]
MVGEAKSQQGQKHHCRENVFCSQQNFEQKRRKSNQAENSDFTADEQIKIVNRLALPGFRQSELFVKSAGR